MGCTAKFPEMKLESAFGREINIQFSGNSTSEHSCTLKILDMSGIVLYDKTVKQSCEIARWMDYFCKG